MSSPAPIPFTDLPILALEAEQPLRRFVLLAKYLDMGHESIRGAWQAMKDERSARPSRSSLFNIRAQLSDLLLSSFHGRQVNLYQTTYGARVMGLSEDGRTVLRFAVEFLAKRDSERAHGR